MVATPAPRSPLQWPLAGLSLAVGVLGMTAAWLAVALFLKSPAGWMAPLVALDMALMLRLAAAPPGQGRAWLAIAGTVTAVCLSYWLFASAQMAQVLGLSVLESAQRLGPTLAWELVGYATSPWDGAWLLLALGLAWWFGR